MGDVLRIPTTIALALVEIQKDLAPMEKSATNSEYDSSYVPLEAVTEFAHTLLSGQGIAVLQPLTTHESGHPAIETILVHAETGESFSRVTKLAIKDANPQAHGSAVTYTRRYALMSMIGLTGKNEDDDGNRASGIFAPVTEEQKDHLRSLMKHLKYPHTAMAAEIFNIKTRDHAYIAIKNFETTIAGKARDEESKDNASEVEFGKKINVTDGTDADGEPALPAGEIEPPSPTSLDGFKQRIKALGLKDETMERKVIGMGSGGAKAGTPFLPKVLDKPERIESLHNFLLALESGVHALPGEYYAPTDEPRVVQEDVA